MQADRKIYLSPPWTDDAERAAVQAAFDSGFIAPCGPMVEAFEQRLSGLCGLPAAAVSSGTAALDLLMDEYAVDAGCVVFAPSLTFIATVGPAARRGAEIVFIDTDAETGTVDTVQLARALADARKEKPYARRLIIAADLYGQCCDYDTLEDLAREYRATLIIDAAEAVGATYKGRAAGQAGEAAVYSFNGNKIITTSGGGAVLSSNEARVTRARWRAQQAREPVPWYEHREIGTNARMSNLLAAVGLAQLDKLPEILRRKKAHFERWRALLGDQARPYPSAANVTSSHWLSVFIFESQTQRDNVAARLARAHAETRPVWKPLHMQSVFAGAKRYGTEVCEDFFRRGLCLPSGAGLTAQDWNRLENALLA